MSYALSYEGSEAMHHSPDGASRHVWHLLLTIGGTIRQILERLPQTSV
jgi:hypothetical protein